MTSTDPAPALRSARLVLRPLTVAAATAALTGDRGRRRWCSGYPTDGDLVIARITVADPPTGGHPFRPYEVVLREDVTLPAALAALAGCTVGGAGFVAPPYQGQVELGYRLAPVVRGHGLATEAAAALVESACAAGIVAVHARSGPANSASLRVLAKLGMRLAGRDDSDPAAPLLCFRLDNPGGAGMAAAGGCPGRRGT